jgi:hypothetical protein
LLISFYFFSSEIFFRFPIWLLGIACRFKFDFRDFKNESLIFLVSLLMFLAVIAIGTLYENLISDYFVGVFFGFFLFCLQNIRIQINKKVHYLAIFLSSFSFTLYAIHFPIEFSVYEVLKYFSLLDIRLKDAGFVNWLILLLIIIFVYFISFVIYSFTEKNYEKVRQKVLQIKL